MVLGPVEAIETSFVDRRGARRRAFRWPARRPFMGLLILHTFGAHAGRYDRPAGEFAVAGISVEAFDLPGHGASGEERGAIGDWPAILDDVADRLAALRSEVPDLPVAIYGHGLGGLIAADYQRSGRPAADALVLAAPALPVPARKPSLRESIARRFRSPEPDRIALDPSQMAADPELAESWQSDALAVWAYPPSAVSAIRDAQARVGTSLDPIPGPIYLIESHDDPIAPFDHRARHLTQDPPEHVMFNQSGARHDMASDLGWRERAGGQAGFLWRVAERHWPASTPAHPERKDYDRMPRAQAVAEFEAYVAGEDERLARFRELVDRLEGPTLGCDAEAMNGLGAWLLEAIEWGEPPTNPPAWFVPRGTGNELSAASVALIDGAATHFAACLRAAAPELEWRLCTTKIDAYYQRPVLEPIHLCPPVPVGSVVHLARNGDAHPDWLGNAWTVWRRDLATLRARGFVVDEDDPLPLDEIGVDPYDDERFNAQIWIPEGAEAVLGEARFVALQDRFAKLKGIEEVVHEDREVFLVRVAKDRDLEAVRNSVVGVVRRMKQAAARDESAAESPSDGRPRT